MLLAASYLQMQMGARRALARLTQYRLQDELSTKRLKRRERQEDV
jgi:hypothetical protein